MGLSMDDAKLFTEIDIDVGDIAVGDLLKDCQRNKLCDEIAIVYRPYDEAKRNGFKFCVVMSVGSSGKFEDVFEDPETVCEILFHGIVYYDGLRHLHCGSEETKNDGYLYCFNSLDGVRIFTALRELELEWCNVEELEE